MQFNVIYSKINFYLIYFFKVHVKFKKFNDKIGILSEPIIVASEWASFPSFAVLKNDISNDPNDQSIYLHSGG